MNEQISRSLEAVNDFKALLQLEKNVQERVVYDAEVAAAFKARGEVIARAMILDRAKLDRSKLTPAEEKVIRVVSEYLAIKKRERSNANRTLDQLRNRGLIEAVETAVSKAKPTQGYETLHKANLDDLSYEQIVIDHPEEFSPRALWFARRTLGLKNASEKAPARPTIPAQIRTEELLDWLKARAAQGDGYIIPFANADAAAALGMTDMARHGRVYGNIQSRLDFACYRLGLPPLGLTAATAFPDAWAREDRSWVFPVQDMQRAAQAFRWLPSIFEALVIETRSLSGQAYLSWKAELHDNQAAVRAWAEGLGDRTHGSDPPSSRTSEPSSRIEESSLPVSAYESEAELELLGEDRNTVGEKAAKDAPNTLDRLGKLESKFWNAKPGVKARVSRSIERGQIGGEVKRLNGFRCQLCDALGRNPFGFRKRNGEFYVEAHHVMPVHYKEIGSLSSANIVSLCANHHREVHFGDVDVAICDENFVFRIEGKDVTIRRAKVKMRIGILAYGSLLTDPGDELESITVATIHDIQTPFEIEYARSSDTRKGAPTLVPVLDAGMKVNASIYEVDADLATACNVLYRREINKLGSGKTYTEPEPGDPKRVSIEKHVGLGGLHVVLSTKLTPNITPLTAEHLAALAIESARNLDDGRDGISYLMNATERGIVTPLSKTYAEEIMRRLGVTSLAEAVEAARST